MDALLFLVMGAVAMGSQTLYIRALLVGETSVVTLLDYARLPMTALLGFLVFQEIPDVFTWIGAAIVIAATAYITWRERRLHPAPEAAAPPPIA